MTQHWQGDPCWNPFCRVRGPHGDFHVGELHHGQPWRQPKGWIYNTETRTYEPPPPGEVETR